MTIETDDRSGFCFGVVRAIEMAERAVEGGETVFSLGDIVHNRSEVQRLEGIGMRSVTMGEFEGLRGRRVLIRAHGEPPSTYEKARAGGNTVVDATCPVVARLQKEVGRAYCLMRPVGGRVVILGKRGHAEVVGLAGQAGGDVTVIESPEELDKLDYTRPIYLLSQTTQSLTLFDRVSREIVRRAAAAGMDPGEVTVRDTICRQVADREPHLGRFAARYDVVVFVSGAKSSNGRMLYEVCRAANPASHMVEDPSGLRAEWFAGAATVGVCGATSTPKWIMERVAQRIGEIARKQNTL